MLIWRICFFFKEKKLMKKSLFSQNKNKIKIINDENAFL